MNAHQVFPVLVVRRANTRVQLCSAPLDVALLIKHSTSHSLSVSLKAQTSAGVVVPSILIHGPSGVGKSAIVRGVGSKLGVEVLDLNVSKLDLTNPPRSSDLCIRLVDHVDLVCPKENLSPAHIILVQTMKILKEEGDNAVFVLLTSDISHVHLDLLRACLTVELQKSAPRLGGHGIDFSNVGGLEKAKARLREVMVLPARNKDLFQRCGIRPARGVLLYGPPGTGKTLLAKAAAAANNCNFIGVSLPDLVRSGMGDSERMLCKLFQDAREKAPCVLFFDEFQAVFGTRDAAGDSGRKLLSQMMQEFDDLSRLPSYSLSVVVLAATNVPEAIDKSFLRPGRFDYAIQVGLPAEGDRLEILKLLTKDDSEGVALDSAVCLKAIASRTHGFSGADLKNLLRQSGVGALTRHPESEMVLQEDIERVLQTFKPSVDASVYNFSEMRQALDLE